MRVALITVGDTRRLTGGYLYQARVVAGLRARGVDVAEVVASGASLPEQLRSADAFAAAFDPRAYDAIIVDALARAACAPAIDRWRALRPVVVLVHQLPSIAESAPEDVARERALEAALLRADVLIAVSAHGRDVLLGRGVAPERVVVVSPGFDRLPAAPVDPTPERAQRIVLCVAQWVPRKGILTLVGAWQRANPAAATLVLIGETDADPSYAARVRAAIARGPASVEVRGIVSDAELHAAYCSADLFVLPSRFEGYGMVYAEALSYGLPVVACAVGPVPDLITEAAGRFVAPDDQEALAAALTRLLDDARLRRHLAAGARQRAAALPSWDDAVRGFLAVLRRVGPPGL